MSAELIAFLSIAGFLFAIGTWLVWRALRSPAGWEVWFLYGVCRLYCGLWLRWTAKGKNRIPRDSAAIVVSNHTSPVDPMILWNNHDSNWRDGKIRVPGFMMAREYYETPGLVGWISRTMKSIPVARDGRDMTAVKAALRKLKDGELLGVFPEGGINETPERLRKCSTGVAFIALKSKAPVLPVFIHNSPRGSTMINSFYTPAKSGVTYGEPIDLSKWYDLKPSQDVLAEVTDHIMHRLAALGGVGYDALLDSDEAAVLPMEQETA